MSIAHHHSVPRWEDITLTDWIRCTMLLPVFKRNNFSGAQGHYGQMCLPHVTRDSWTLTATTHISALPWTLPASLKQISESEPANISFCGYTALTTSAFSTP